MNSPLAKLQNIEKWKDYFRSEKPTLYLRKQTVLRTGGGKMNPSKLELPMQKTSWPSTKPAPPPVGWAGHTEHP